MQTKKKMEWAIWNKGDFYGKKVVAITKGGRQRRRTRKQLPIISEVCTKGKG